LRRTLKNYKGNLRLRCQGEGHNKETIPMRKIFAIVVAAILILPLQAKSVQLPRVAKGHPEVCKAFPASLVKDFRNEYPVIECGWSVEIGVSGGAMTGGFAGVQTDRDIGVYKMFKEVQQQLIKTYGNEPGVTINDQHGIIDCADSRMVVLRDKGVPTWSHFTALCDGLGIGFVTVGPKFTTDDTAKFGQIVRMLVRDRVKAKK
jgi:hypothetical protein